MDPIDEVQSVVFHALFLVGDRSAAVPLVRLIETADLRIQQQALNALIGCVRGELYSPLVELVQRPGKIRRFAIFALAQSADPLALPIIRPMLDDTDPCVRIEAIKA
jgi:HEAT repeat protein